MLIMMLFFSVRVVAENVPELSAINVNDLDSSISSLSLEQWLSSVSGDDWLISRTRELTGCGANFRGSQTSRLSIMYRNKP